MEKDSILDKFLIHLNSISVSCNALDPGSVDIDYGFRQKMPGYTGTMNVGSFRIFSGNIDYVNIIERLDYQVGSKSYGRYSRSEHVADQWQVRYFLQTNKQGKLAQVDIFTESLLEKGLMHSKVVDAVWKGSGKLTTLPSHIQNDDLLEKLNSDQKLKKMLVHNLIKEKSIRVNAYLPKKKDAEEWKDYFVIFGEWRDRKELFVTKECFEMYDRIAYSVKEMVNSLKYW
jgi:hypothetical protein